LPKDPQLPEKIRSSCDDCLKTKVKCGQTKPSCTRCITHGRQCVYSQSRKPGRPSKAISEANWSKDQQRTAKDTKRKSLKQSRRQSIQNNARTDGQVRQNQRPPTPRSASNSIIGTHLNGLPTNSLSLNTLVTQFANSGVESDTDAHIENATSVIGGSTFPSNDNVASADRLTDFFTPLNYSMENIDWSNWESVFDASASLSPIQNNAQVRTPNKLHHGNQSHLDDPFPGVISPSNPESGDSSKGNLLNGLYPSPPQSAAGRVFSRPSFSAGSTFGLLETLALERQVKPATNIIQHSSRTPLSHNRDFIPSSISTSGSRCTNQCHFNLTNQLTEITEFQVKGSSIALDVLLGLDDQVRKTRAKTLACSFCLAAPRFPQTLMLLTMVLGDLLSLFERSFEDLLVNMVPLTVGELKLNEIVKVDFSQQLIRMYLEVQEKAVRQLRSLLESGERGNVSSKFTSELLEDLSGRLGRSVAYITLKSSGDISTVS
jgi:hypothetical protein